MTLNRVLPDAINDGVREINVKVTEEKNAVRILERNEGGRHAGVKTSTFITFVILFYCSTHFDEVDPGLQTGRALKSSTQLYILVPEGRYAHETHLVHARECEKQNAHR